MARRKFSVSSKTVDMSVAIQKQGILMKRPFGHQSNKWSRRFFVLKDGFLLYYSEAEKKAYDEKRFFNIHPKGVVPLGNCRIEDTSLSGIPYGINICLPDDKTVICVAAEDHEIRNAWIKALERSSKINHESLQLGDTMIKSLQSQSLQMARERQEYVDKYITEAEELGIERKQNEELEKLVTQLSQEKSDIELLVQELQITQAEIKEDFETTLEQSKILEDDRNDMIEQTNQLKIAMQELNQERDSVMKILHNSDVHEGQHPEIQEVSVELLEKLDAIMESSRQLEHDKANIQERLEENEKNTKKIEKEKESFYRESEDLKSEIQELNKEKVNTEENLREEMMLKQKLRTELGECKEALSRLVDELVNSKCGKCGFNQHDSQQIALLKDVKSLKMFFEEIAIRNMIEVQKLKPVSKLRVSKRLSHMNLSLPNTNGTPAESNGLKPVGLARAKAYAKSFRRR